MGRNIDSIIKSLPPERRKRVMAQSQRMAADMIRHADSLEQLRKAVGKTQAEVAEKLGIKQHAISQLESRADLYVSTLDKYVRALGHKLELALVTADGERVELPNLHPWDRRSSGEVAKPVPKRKTAMRTARAPLRQATATASVGPARRKSQVKREVSVDSRPSRVRSK